MATTPDPSSSQINTHVTDLPSSSLHMDSIISLTLPVAIKLNKTNFLTWKSQVLPLIHGYNLSRFLDSPHLETTVQKCNSEIEINPAYLHWHRQDQLLLGWLQSSLTEPLLAQVISSTTTRFFWTTLDKYYASTSRSRIHDLRCQIQTASKGNLSCSDYLIRLQWVADELAFIGSPISEDDMVTTTINGLGSDYNSIVATLSIARCPSSFSFFDLRGLLLRHEALLQTQAELIPSAFYADREGRDNWTRYQNRSDNRQLSNSRPNHLQSNSIFTSRPNSTQSNSTEERPTCQICTKYGHSAKLCYRRYNHDPNWKPNSRSNQNVHAFTTQVNSSTQDSTNWIINSGANQHVTNNINNLSSFFAYKGPDQLHIGNGLSLLISHIGSTSFTLSNHSFNLTIFFMFLIFLLIFLVYHNYFLTIPHSPLFSLLLSVFLRTSKPRLLQLKFLASIGYTHSSSSLPFFFSSLSKHPHYY